MKKVLMVIATLLALVVMIPSPANAASQGLSCPGHPNLSGNLSVTVDGNLYKMVGTFNDSASPHTVNWEMKHDGSLVSSGARTGSFTTLPQWTANNAGTDTFWFHVYNSANNINCTAAVAL